MTPLGTVLKLYRAANDITQKSLAEEIGVSARSLSRFEKGKPVDQATTIKLIAWAFSDTGNG